MKPQNTPVVVTGSAAQVPPEIASQLGIVILPLTIMVEGKEYLDGIDLFPGELYQKMRAQKIDVKTRLLRPMSDNTMRVLRELLTSRKAMCFVFPFPGN